MSPLVDVLSTLGIVVAALVVGTVAQVLLSRGGAPRGAAEPPALQEHQQRVRGSIGGGPTI